VDPRFLDLGTVATVSDQPLYPWYPLDRKLSGAPQPVWTTWRIFLTLLGLELRPLRRPARSQCLYRLIYRGSYIITCTERFVSPLETDSALVIRRRSLEPDLLYAFELLLSVMRTLGMWRRVGGGEVLLPVETLERGLS
jgi:hypothetical protein